MLDRDISTLPVTSGLTIKRLKNLGVNTYWDLLNYFPARHSNRAIIAPIFSLQEGDQVTIQGEVLSMKNEFTRRGIKIQKAQVADHSGQVTLTWFNQYYVLTAFKKGDVISAYGEMKKYKSTKTFLPQEFEVIRPELPTLHTGRLVPIYPEKRGLSSKTIREKVWYIIQQLSQEAAQVAGDLEYLPPRLLTQYQLIDEMRAYMQIHFPTSAKDEEKARSRLSFDELFLLQLATHFVKKEWEKEKVSTPIQVTNYKLQIERFISSLPFALTDSQQKVIQEILRDLNKTKPMNRFLQGDVGSGKTIVAAIAAYVSHLNSFQSLIMAPTEILASQHFATLSKIFKKQDLKIGLQTKSQKIDKKENKLDSYDIVIGTHALLNQRLKLDRIGFVVIDEQHRFGVRQRALLKEKGIYPHLLTMTATPIPRTVSLTMLGELDISLLNEMPKDRLPIKSYVVEKSKRESAYTWITKTIKEKREQAYIICPLIEESEIESMKSVRAATEEYKRLQKDVFPTLRLGLLHGKMKSQEKDDIMVKFKKHEFDILVATSVVEVGIDVPNATIIVIEGAERFGMAQLHQMRGRVGRSDKQSYCLLFSSFENPQLRMRLTYFANHNQGIDIAEYDLKMRGPGELYGTRQHGIIELKIASYANYPLLELTQRAVANFVEHYDLSDYPKLRQKLDAVATFQISRD